MKLIEEYHNSKHCSKCKQLMKYSEFNKKARNKDGYMGFCKECLKTGRNKVTAKGLYVTKNYGISLGIYEDIMKQAGDICPLCGAAYGKPRSSHGKVLDHCHSTGKIRGVICSSCNSGLGFARDSEETLKNMIKWIH